MPRAKDHETYTKNSVVTTDGKHEYPIDFVRELFINSDKSIEELAVQLNLPVATVKHHASRGLQTWYNLKTEKFSERMKYFMELNIDNLMETHSLLEDIHFLAIVQIQGTQRFLKDYYAAKGHLFRVNDEGEISTDGYGMPIPLPLPHSPKELLALEQLLKLKEGTKQAINQVYEASKNSNKSDIIDVNDYGLFEKEPSK